MQNIQLLANDDFKQGLLDNPLEEFSIQDEVLTIKTKVWGKKINFQANVADVVVTYVVENFTAMYYFKAKDGKKVGIIPSSAQMPAEKIAEMEQIIESLPGYKGRQRWQKIFLAVLIIVGLLLFFASMS